MQSSTGILRAAGVIPAVVAALFSMAVHSGSAVTPGSRAAGMEACVAPTAEIRRYHMDYLKHDRIKVVRDGVRGVKYSLAECVDCHAEQDGNGGYHPVNGDGQFCNKCHEYLAVSLTCFQCHSKKPEQKRSAASLSGEKNAGQSSLFGLLMKFDEAPALSAEEMAQLHAISRED
ncbi:MAG: sulfur reduction protein DsrJ [Gammaproteobacteria bacterium]|nr:sulfur reduction protein DsrJ [Gammaproteobacteria bacterium]HXK57383.1 sulfur reduction protein DsrJ [Gammaproteobacteria bacterium]